MQHQIMADINTCFVTNLLNECAPLLLCKVFSSFTYALHNSTRVLLNKGWLESLKNIIEEVLLVMVTFFDHQK